MIGNLLQNLPDDCSREIFDTLLSADDVRIERIVSSGQSSPSGFWYDQPEHEFVLVLQGNAVLTLHDGARYELQPGSWMHIPPRQKHRVDATSRNPKTVWLAIFWPGRDD